MVRKKKQEDSMGACHSVVTALRSVLRQPGLKVATKILEGFVKEVDRIAPWFACSGSLTIPSWEKLKGDLVRELENGKLKAGTMPLWKLIRSCLKEEECQQVVKVGQRILNEIQDTLSEVERVERLGAKQKHGASIKHTGLSMDLEPEEKIMSGKNTQGEFGRKEKEKEKKDQSVEVPRRRNLYPPLDEFKDLALSSSESDEELSPSEETDLEEEAACYEGERYQPDKMQANQSRKRPKVAGESQLAAQPPDCRLQGPSASAPAEWRLPIHH
jgi:protein O-GlcNAc transferase